MKASSEQLIYTDADYVRFWTKVAITANPDKCWEWQSVLSPSGYGNFYLNKKTRSAHRIAYLFYHKKQVGNLSICHKCDNRKCVNPNHFFLGTHKDNAIDAKKKGRLATGLRSGKYTHPELVQKGAAHGMSKLTDEQVLEIRTLYVRSAPNKRRGMFQSELAEKFGVSQILISLIVRRKIWTHI